MDASGHEPDDLFLDALEAVVLAALEQIGDDPEARFRFFRRVLTVAREAAGNSGDAPGPTASPVRTSYVDAPSSRESS
jgi:hypothetical protein